MKRVLVFGEFRILSEGHISFLESANKLSGGGSCIVALDNKNEKTFDQRKNALLGTGYVSQVVPVSDVKECVTVVKNMNIDIYAYGNPKVHIDGMDCNVHQIIRNKAGGVFIPFLVVVVGRKCTLKCKNCSNLIPYSPPDMMSYDYKQILADLLVITQVADVNIIQFQGGEPFVYPNLSELLKFALDSNAISQVRIATNGTVFPNVGLELLANPKLEVRISNYPIVTKKAHELENFLNENGIANRRHDFASGVGLWNDLGDVDVEPSKGDISEIFAGCGKSHCLTLENGLIGHCSRCICAPSIQKFQPKEGDYLTIRGERFKERLFDYVTYPKAMEACRYCNGGYSNGIFVEAALQL